MWQIWEPTKQGVTSQNRTKSWMSILICYHDGRDTLYGRLDRFRDSKAQGLYDDWVCDRSIQMVNQMAVALQL